MLIHSCGTARRPLARLNGKGWLAALQNSRNRRHRAVVLDRRPRRNCKQTSRNIVVAISRKTLRLSHVTESSLIVAHHEPWQLPPSFTRRLYFSHLHKKRSAARPRRAVADESVCGDGH